MTQPEVEKLRVLLTRTCHCVWNKQFHDGNIFNLCNQEKITQAPEAHSFRVLYRTDFNNFQLFWQYSTSKLKQTSSSCS